MSNKLQLFTSMLKIGCIGFGGGSAIIPIIEDEIVETGIDTKENIDKDVMVANITPGALPVEVAASIGKRAGGNKGMFLSALAMALPGALAAIAIFTIFSTMKLTVLNVIELASVGVSIFILYMLKVYIGNVFNKCAGNTKCERKNVILMAISLFVVCGKNLYQLLGISKTPVFSLSAFNALMLFFFCIIFMENNRHKNVGFVAIMVIISTLFAVTHGKGNYIDNNYIMYALDAIMIMISLAGIVDDMKNSGMKIKIYKNFFKELYIWIVFLVICSMPALINNANIVEFIGKGIISAFMSFGGGDAYLTIADGLFVDTNMVTESQFYGHIVSVVNVLPGSILCKTLCGVGYYLGINISGSIVTGVLFAIVGFACSIAASCGFYMIIYHLYNNLSSLRIISRISECIRPIIAGFLINISLSLCNQSVRVMGKYQISGISTIIIVVLMFIITCLLKSKTRISNALILVLNIGTVFIIWALHYI